jgi:hypothetical protein
MACGDGGGFPDAPGPGDAFATGTLSLTWTVVKMADGSPVSCDQIGANSVTLLLRNRGFQGGFTEVFSCVTGSGTTSQLPVGTYDVMFELTGTTGTIATGAEQMGLVISKQQNTPLSPVAFSVNAVGGLDLRVTANKGGGNCATVANNGAGITAMTITLNHVSGGACEPATLMIGGSPYTIDCASPVSTGCIETTTPITATGVPSDNYQIHVRGNQGALPCFVNDDTLRVPANAATTTRTLNLAASGQSGCL